MGYQMSLMGSKCQMGYHLYLFEYHFCSIELQFRKNHLAQGFVISTLFYGVLLKIVLHIFGSLLSAVANLFCRRLGLMAYSFGSLSHSMPNFLGPLLHFVSSF